MGLPAKLIAATNANDAMHRLLSDGLLSRGDSSVAQTTSPSMDIQARAVHAVRAERPKGRKAMRDVLAVHAVLAAPRLCCCTSRWPPLASRLSPLAPRPSPLAPRPSPCRAGCSPSPLP